MTSEDSHEMPELRFEGLGSAFAEWHWRGYLPHMKTQDGTYFVTFRLAGTLPQNVLQGFRLEREEIIKRARASGREISDSERKRLADLYSKRVESYLNAGYGKCWLAHPEIGGMVAKALLHFDGQRYDLHAWVVMPNHVHVVLTPIEDCPLSDILHSWKSFTGHKSQEIAQAFCLCIHKGEPFWQRESYDHLVRDVEDFARVIEYTIMNPVNAGLCDRPEDWPNLGVSKAVARALLG